MVIEPLDVSIQTKRKKFISTWWGQTCDSCDWIIKDKEHPEYNRGEWVITKDIGAYS